MIVAISDVHLGYEKCNIEQFESFITNFLEKEEIKDLVLLGDIMDFWRRFNEGVLFENLPILYTLGALANSNTNVHYVIGNHDYSLSNLEEYQIPQFDFKKELLLKNGDQQFYFIHGYQIEAAGKQELYEQVYRVLCSSGDKLGGILSIIWDIYEQHIKSIFVRKELTCKRMELRELNIKKMKEIIEFVQKDPAERKKSSLYREEIFQSARLIAEYDEAFKIGEEDVLVYGHTHDPFVKKYEVNTGSWVSGEYKSNSYVIIDDGKVELKFWE
jgi:UDP-2,3-diacylglucosamine pyrophosphatase LpxH